jgi:triosephosphate isomerase (TIM)
MHKTGSEAVQTTERLIALTTDVTDVEVMIAPPFTALTEVAKVILDTPIALGAQNVFWEPKGAFTGEISTEMLKAAGCRYVIIGHSERRQYFGETDASVNKRIQAAIGSGLYPVFCIGETEAERLQNQTFSILDKQVGIGLKGFAAQDIKNLVIAYEPVWAIGTGQAATSDQAQEVHAYIRDLVAKKFGFSTADATRILYGGSVKPGNINELMARSDIDGALVGGASLDADTFSELVRFKINK